ncbi:hypothetical protein wVul_0096 [Wolbachia endosymbiont of Armadillidium vulgare str. wVulC]|uniref:hypothetical protein n=1 Tax=Wolbachia endosymbiont of Armadillidium vulgare TaxID=77039 RepID=UPI00064B4BD0|nr:hypothetical protein [Wolbachia endosymbiont of Armadillidium vulgare]KLT22893.1 hypothetical protein wVul_0096 [Wolbachia endosymbiont of Armadillidium vulgare str. wVulC]OJH31633.1 hypothetical protein Wxf_01027 [Wolbachia endosymbiont of Armadillidium vulgare]OJH32042.1 hypothetical protein Wxf_01461 [Wolbachia endosymbiont of Armadillidium vulgare]OJH32599.1 hypothetical protein Wxf_02041 [Wolbachia endosymbiont of Armadillidium vulgare]OJH33221.1 hypothetical protein Wxf_02695 [Wolbach
MLLGNSKDTITYRPVTFEKLHRHIEQIIYKLEEDQVIEDIIDIMEEVGVAVNELKSVEEIKKYLKRGPVKRTMVSSKVYNLQKIEKSRKENYICLST